MHQRNHGGAGLGWPQLPSWPVLGQDTSPLCSCKHQAGVLPRCPHWFCCFPPCLCIPLASDGCHTQHDLCIQKANKCVVCGHWDLLCALLSGGTGEGRRNGFAEVPQGPAAGSPPLPPAPVSVEPWHQHARCPSICLLLACHASLNSNSPELHAGPQGNQGGISINYLLNLDKYYNK